MVACLMAAQLLVSGVGGGVEPVLPVCNEPEAVSAAVLQTSISLSLALGSAQPAIVLKDGLKPPSPSTMAAATDAVAIPSLLLMPGLAPPKSRAETVDAASSPPGAAAVRPVSGDQLFQFRTAAVQAGVLYTRASPQPYIDQWQRVIGSPTHADWQGLLRQEAEIMARTQGRLPLTVVVGDSLALWLPVEALPRDRLWLNQSISGETTVHMLNRLDYFAPTQPDRIYLMAGINDLKNGASEAEVVQNIDQILAQLRQQHPQAQIVVYSILPTRLANLPSGLIRRVNHAIANVATQRTATFLDLQTTFADGQGQLRPELTTDGLHLSRQGYDVWQSTMVNDGPRF